MMPMIFTAILFICALSSKNLPIYNEELIVTGCFTGFILLTRRSFGDTFQATFDARMEAIQEELQRSVPNEALLLEAKEQERLLRNAFTLALRESSFLTDLKAR